MNKSTEDLLTRLQREREARLKYRYKYAVHDDDAENTYTLKSETNIGDAIPGDDGVDRWSLENLAEEAAEDFQDNHDGWELNDNAWPITLYLYTHDGVRLGGFEVEREYEPKFKASLVSADGERAEV